MEQIFCSENIVYVKVSRELIDEYLKMVNDMENVARYIGNKQPYSYEEELNFITAKLEEDAAIFSMIEKSSGEFIGNIEFMDSNDRCSELGIAITAEKQDRKYGTEAIKRMLAYGYDELGLKRVFLKAYLYNERAIHVYEKCGFTKYDETDTEVYMEIRFPAG